MRSLRDEAYQFSEQYQGGNSAAAAGDLAAFYALFTAIRTLPVPLGFTPNAIPFVLRHTDLLRAWQEDDATDHHGNDAFKNRDNDATRNTQWPGFFTLEHVQQAVEEDFLDALRGSTDNRKGWKVNAVSVPRGDSFEQARMTFEEVKQALTLGTVIFNAAGAHIPRLAGPTWACTAGTLTPAALNIYITAPEQRTSAPPHTDKQDVIVVQTSGQKGWKVFSPPDSSIKPGSDPMARGKGDDSLSLYSLEQEGCQLLLETVLEPGDVLYCPAGFPHTTTTATNSNPEEGARSTAQETSVHLTFNIDHHIWDMNYLYARHYALQKAGITNDPLYSSNLYTGPVNRLPASIKNDLFRPLPLELLQQQQADSAFASGGAQDEHLETVIEHAASELQRVSQAADPTSFAQISDPSIWKDTILRLRQQGLELWAIHRDMYLAAMDEGRIRQEEEALLAHVKSSSSSSPATTSSSASSKSKVLTTERLQRLSLFRVKRYYDAINDSRQALKDWAKAGTRQTLTTSSTTTVDSDALVAGKGIGLGQDWVFTGPVKVGMEVEAELGGAFFPARITRASGGTYDVDFFDGDRETGLQRNQIKLLSPPVLVDEDMRTAGMTPKQLKRWKKQNQVQA